MNAHICPVEVAAFFASLSVVRWLWHCCAGKVAALKCEHKRQPKKP